MVSMVASRALGIFKPNAVVVPAERLTEFSFSFFDGLEPSYRKQNKTPSLFRVRAFATRK